MNMNENICNMQDDVIEFGVVSVEMQGGLLINEVIGGFVLMGIL